MKRIVSSLLTGVLVLTLTACGTDRQESSKSSEVSSEPGGTQQQTVSNELTLLCDDSSSFSNHFGTESGFYYFTESNKIADKLSGMHLMYIDYATKKEVFLCSDSGCLHDSEQCSSVYAQDEFGTDSLPFVWGDALYVLSRDYDTDGNTSFNFGEGATTPEAKKVNLYRMNLDGSSRQKIYTFSDDITTEKLVFGDGDNLWFVTKKLQTQSEKAGDYTTSTDRNLSKYSISENKIIDTISLDFGDNIYQTVVGASGGTFVLNGVAYPDGMSEADVMKLSDEEWKEICKNSSTIYSSLDVRSKNKKEIYCIDSSGMQSTCSVKDGVLFVSDCGDSGIVKINLASGKKTKFANLAQNYIYFSLADTLCCLDTGKTDDTTLYFADMKTGEIYHSTLTNKSLGWQLDVLADTDDQVLVVYDYDATENGDQYTINAYKYALISKDDLYNSKANYSPIAMAGGGK